MKVNENVKVKKIAIFGGSFDPPHFGHVDIVKNLERVFDNVIVVPSFISPFKSGADAAAERYKLCKKVFSSGKTVVSKREISRGGISYSVDTAEYFFKKYRKDNVKLYFVIGSEELTRLDEWHDIDKLSKLVTFFVVKRPGFDVNDGKVKSLKKKGIKLAYAKFGGVNISSTAIKIDLAFGKENKMMPDAVYSAAVNKGLFNPYAKYVQALHNHGLKARRIEHSYGVAQCGAELAKRYGTNVNDTVIACILHDIAKEEDVKDYKQVDLSGFPAPTVHAPIGAYIAKQEFGVSKDIEHAIRTHTTASDDMSDIGEMVYLADKLEVGRKYDQVYELRKIASEDKDAAMFATIKAIADWEETKEDTETCSFTNAAIEKYWAKVERNAHFPAVSKQTLPANSRTKTAALSEVKSKAVRLVPMTEKSVTKVNEHKELMPTPRQETKIVFRSNASAKDIAKSVASELSLHKAHDISIIDLEGKTIIADYFVLCSATSSTAVKALYGYVEDRMTKEFGLDPTRRDVDREWVALDYGSVIIHIFTDKTREFYNIERLWSDGHNVEKYGD